MKTKILLFLFAICAVGLFFAGAKDRTRPTASATVYNNSSDKGYCVTGGAAGDTIVVSDTLQIPIQVDHSALLKPYIQLYWDKIGSGTATVTLTFWQSVDGVNYQQLKKGKLQGAYSKSLSCSSDSLHFFSFALDSVVLEGRYLKMRYITSSTASVKAKLTHRIKFNL